MPERKTVFLSEKPSGSPTRYSLFTGGCTFSTNIRRSVQAPPRTASDKSTPNERPFFPKKAVRVAHAALPVHWRQYVFHEHPVLRPSTRPGLRATKARRTKDRFLPETLSRPPTRCPHSTGGCSFSTNIRRSVHAPVPNCGRQKHAAGFFPNRLCPARQKRIDEQARGMRPVSQKTPLSGSHTGRAI